MSRPRGFKSRRSGLSHGGEARTRDRRQVTKGWYGFGGQVHGLYDMKGELQEATRYSYGATGNCQAERTRQAINKRLTMTENQPLETRLDHTPGKYTWDNADWIRITRKRAVLLQAIHDERDLCRVREMMADFVSPASRDDFVIRLPLRCHYVGCVTSSRLDTKLITGLQGYNIHLGAGSMINHNATILDEAKGRSTSSLSPLEHH
jgi:hypothetical protein